MTKVALQSAGYIIIANDTIIQSVGGSVVEAWDILRKELGPGVTFLSDDDEMPEDGNFDRESNYRCLPATEALIALVTENGCNIKFTMQNGIACIKEEAEACSA